MNEGFTRAAYATITWPGRARRALVIVSLRSITGLRGSFLSFSPFNNKAWGPQAIESIRFARGAGAAARRALSVIDGRLYYLYQPTISEASCLVDVQRQVMRVEKFYVTKPQLLVGALSAKIEINHCSFENTFQNFCLKITTDSHIVWLK